MRALVSTYDKTGIVEFAKELTELGIEVISTGGTANAIRNAGIPVKEVSEITKFPEILDGRVKTLHPIIHGGILARRDCENHLKQIDGLGIEAIDIVVVNLYPFVETIKSDNSNLIDALENIDIGGPTLLRAAAKSFPDVLPLVHSLDFKWIIERLKAFTEITIEERKLLAKKAFQHVSQYDSSISRYLADKNDVSTEEIAIGFEKVRELRYGENPHQKATLFADTTTTGGLINSIQLHGSEMSYNNFVDADSALKIVSDFPSHASVIVKHTNPCGLSVSDSQPYAYQNAFDGDQTSAFGGIVAFNSTLTIDTAKAMRGVFFEMVLAPDFDPEALEILKRRRNRIIKIQELTTHASLIDIRQISGGALVQTPDVSEKTQTEWRVVTEKIPTDQQMEDLEFAWKACKHVKSNAIVLAKENTMIGMGAGQPNRVISVKLAVQSAGSKTSGSVMSSDAFFPFPDNVEVASKSGISCIIQPGGSIRDAEVIDAANDCGLSMVFTGMRHFLH